MKSILFFIMACILSVTSLFAAGEQETVQPEESGPYYFTAAGPWDLAQGRIDFAKQPEDPVFQYVIDQIGIAPQTYAYDWEGGTGYLQNVRLLLASGTIPEAILEPFTTNFVKELYDLGVLIPLDDYLENAPDVMAMYSDEDLKIIRSLTPDGKIYYLPGKNIEPRQGMIRADWLKAVGKDVPKTRDELVEVYKAFRDMDANGNGDPNDEIPVSGREGMRWLDDLYVMHGVHMYEGHPAWSWDEKTQQMISHQVSDNMKEAVTFLRYLVEEGLMDKVMPFQPAGDWFAKISADRIGHYFHLASGIERRLTMVADGSNPDAEWVYMSPPSVPGLPHQKNFYPGIGAPQIVLTTEAKDPARILEWFNWGVTEEGAKFHHYGIEGVNYEIKGGEIVSEGFPAAQRYHYSPTYASRNAEIYRGTNYGDMKAAIYNASINDGRSLENLGMPVSIWEGYEDFVDSNAGNLYRQYTARFILGELPLSEWDNYVAEWNKKGGAEITRRATEWYKSVYGK
ncbi:MAG: extracellular solute-binding protein [Spirochaetales bacterium]|nr:extracellular solute-binding protein [Spirochaetales bacterium]